MSTFTAFERAKLQRFINVYGNSFTFRRSVLNERKEPTNESEVVAIVNGVFHEASGGYISVSTKDGSRYIKALQPMILCLDSSDVKLLKPDDFVEIHDKVYRIGKLNLVGNLGYAWDISLELVDDGGVT